ncbi:hypothetical protein DSO57_1003939, partial [Entomophthora muscae]
MGDPVYALNPTFSGSGLTSLLDASDSKLQNDAFYLSLAALAPKIQPVKVLEPTDTFEQCELAKRLGPGSKNTSMWDVSIAWILVIVFGQANLRFEATDQENQIVLKLDKHQTMLQSPELELRHLSNSSITCHLGTGFEFPNLPFKAKGQKNQLGVFLDELNAPITIEKLPFRNIVDAIQKLSQTSSLMPQVEPLKLSRRVKNSLKAQAKWYKEIIPPMISLFVIL